jgi:NAD(P)-dependent dehydrogenase (short-subunit alcohol dehydrogenase family)
MAKSGKPVVLVTGAGQGVGRAVANHFKSKGYHVVATDYNDALFEDIKDDTSITTARHNVASVEDAAAVAEKIQAELGRLDVIINNAGINAYLPVVEAPPQRTIDGFMVNTLGPLIVTNACLDLLIASKGCVVNLSSESAPLRTPFQYYQSTKKALECLSDVMRRELGVHDVHIACIRPGAIKTTMTETAGVTNPVENSRFEKSFAVFAQQLVDQMPTNKCTPEEAAQEIFHAATDPKRKPLYAFKNLLKFKIMSRLPAKFLDGQIIKILKG